MDNEAYKLCVINQAPNVARSVFYEFQAVARALVDMRQGQEPRNAPAHLNTFTGGNWRDLDVLKEAYDALYPSFREHCPGRSDNVIAGYVVTENGPVSEEITRQR